MLSVSSASSLAQAALDTAQSGSQSSSNRWIDVVSLTTGERIEGVNLDDIYLSERSVLHQFQIVNNCNFPVFVSLRYELRRPNQSSSVGFQLENENLDLSFENYNEIFNQVGLLSDISLQPEERKPIVMSFRPAEPSIDPSSMGANPTKSQPVKAVEPLLNRPTTGNESDEENERYASQTTSFIPLKGKLILQATPLGEIPTASEADKKDLTSTTQEERLVTLPLRGRLCRSLLRLDVPEVLFDGCVPHGTYVKDFTVWNRAEIPLQFRLSFLSSQPSSELSRKVLEFTEYDTGERLPSEGCMVPAFGNIRVRVTFRPKEVGERTFSIEIQNLNNPRNLKTLAIHTVVTTELHREGLVVRELNLGDLGNGSVLHFGDIYTDTYVAKTLQIRNTSQVALHLHFSSERPKEVTFELAQHVESRRSIKKSQASGDGQDMGAVTPEAVASARDNTETPKYEEEVDEELDEDLIEEEEDEEEEGLEEEDTTRRRLRDILDPDGDSDDEVEGNEVDYVEENYDLQNSEDDNPDPEDGDDDYEFDHKKMSSREGSELAGVEEKGAAGHTEKPSSSPRKSMAETKRGQEIEKSLNRGTRDRVQGMPKDTRADKPNFAYNPPSRPLASVFSASSSDSSWNKAKSKYRIEELTLAPGVERTIILWYCPQHPDPVGVGGAEGNLTGPGSTAPSSSDVDPRIGRLVRQAFRIFIRCREVKGVWQQAQKLDFDDSLGRMLSVRARTCTSVVTINPPVLNFGDCNIGEYKTLSCQIKNLSELPALITPRVNSRVVIVKTLESIVIPPKQPYELKVELVPRSINLNYRRKISIFNRRNKWNRPVVEVRSCNMDTQHVIYHSLFYKLSTNNRFRSPQIYFDHAVVGSCALRTFSLRNLQKHPLRIRLQPSSTDLVLYMVNSSDRVKDKGDDYSPNALTGQDSRWFPGTRKENWLESIGEQMMGTKSKPPASGQNSTFSNQNRKRSESVTNGPEPSPVRGSPPGTRISTETPTLRNPRRRNLFRNGSDNNLVVSMAPFVRELTSGISQGSSIGARDGVDPLGGVPPPSLASAVPSSSAALISRHSSVASLESVNSMDVGERLATERERGGQSQGRAFSAVTDQLASILELASDFELKVPNRPLGPEEEERLVKSTSNRQTELDRAIKEGRLTPLSSLEDIVELEAEADQTIVAVYGPSQDQHEVDPHAVQTEKSKIFIRLLDITTNDLPPSLVKLNQTTGGRSTPFNSGEGTSDGQSLQQSDGEESAANDGEPLRVRELLVRAKVSRSMMSINQKNINLGRMTTTESQCKSVRVTNRSAVPLLYKVTKTGSISSGFLTINDGRIGVVRPFGFKDVQFVFQPTLAGRFEETLAFINIEDPSNTQVITIKARVLKPDTFVLPQAGQTLSLGACILGEKCKELRIAIRNTSKKRREYAIQVDPSLFVCSSKNIIPDFAFNLDTTGGSAISQVQEQKLEEELEKLEHKLRIATTKKKSEKMKLLKGKIADLRALLHSDPAEPTDWKTDGSGASQNAEDEEEDGGEAQSASESKESSPMAQSSKPSQTSKVNLLKFSLKGEEVGYVIASVIFRSATSESTPVIEDWRQSQERRASKEGEEDAEPTLEGALRGRGVLFLYETKNKDVIKELQYVADIFPSGKAGEEAYARATGKPFKRASLILPPTDTEPSKLPDAIDSPLPDAASSPSLGHFTVEAISKIPSDSRQSLPGLQGAASSIELSRLNTCVYIWTDTAQPSSLSSASLSASSSTVTIKSNNTSPEPLTLWVRVRGHNDVFAERPLPYPLYYEVDPPSAVISTIDSPLPQGSANDQSAARMVKFFPDRQGESVRARSDGVDREPKADASTLLSVLRSGVISPSSATRLPSPRPGRGLLQTLILRLEPGAIISLHLQWAGAALPPSHSGIVDLGMLVVKPLNTAIQAKRLPLCAIVPLASPITVKPHRIDLGKHIAQSLVPGHFVVANDSDSEVRVVIIPLVKGSPSPSPAVSLPVSAPPSQSAHSSGSPSPPSLPPVHTPSTTPMGTPSDLIVDQKTLVVAPKAEVTVSFMVKATTPGRHVREILVRNLTNRSDQATVTVYLSVSNPIMIHVPSLDPTCTGKLETLDIGHVYVRPRSGEDGEAVGVAAGATTGESTAGAWSPFPKVVDLTLKNVTESPILLTAKSNLQKQCYVFADKELQQEVSRMRLPPHESTKIYIALQPRLFAEEFRTGSCRELVGGIKVSMEKVMTVLSEEEVVGREPGVEGAEDIVPSMVDKTAEFTIAFRALAGISLMAVSPSFINLGSIPLKELHNALSNQKKGEKGGGKQAKKERRSSGTTAGVQASPSQSCLAGSFQLQNLNRQLQLEYRVRVENVADFDAGDELELTLHESSGVIRGGCSKELHFQVTSARAGLLQRRLVIENVSCPGQISFVDVRLFVDDGSLLSSLTASSENNALGAYLDLGAVPVLSLPRTASVSATGGAFPLGSSPAGGPGSHPVQAALGPSLAALESHSAESGRRHFYIFDSHIHSYREKEPGQEPAEGERRRTFSLTNVSGEAVVLQAMSNLPLQIRWEVVRAVEQAAKVPESTGGFRGFSQKMRSRLTSKLLHGESKKRPPVSQERTRSIPDASSEDWLDVQPGVGGVAPSAVDVLRTCASPYTLEPGETVCVRLRFQWLARTQLLPTESVLAGRTVPFRGILAFLRTSGAKGGFGDSSVDSASPLQAQLKHVAKVVSLSGSYCRPLLELSHSLITLGKVGYVDQWTPKEFSVAVQNISNASLWFGISTLHPDLNFLGADRESSVIRSEATGGEIVPTSSHQKAFPALRDLSILALNRRPDGLGPRIWCLRAQDSCKLRFQLKTTSRKKTADLRRYQISFLNYDTPTNIGKVRVEAEVISRLLSIHFHDNDTLTHKVHEPNAIVLPTLVVPPSPSSHPLACNVWFSVRNVFDEDLEVRFDVAEAELVRDILELETLSRSSNTPLTRTTLAPNERIDVRVVCRASPHARLTSDIIRQCMPLMGNTLDGNADVQLEASPIEGERTAIQVNLEANSRTGEAARDIQDESIAQNCSLALGRLRITMAPASSDSQLAKHGREYQEDLKILGELTPGMTFSLSSSSIHFYTTVEDVRQAVLTLLEEGEEDEHDLQSPKRMDTSDIAGSKPGLRNTAGQAEGETGANQELVAGSQPGLLVRRLLRLRSDTDSFWIQNLSQSHPLNFEILTTAARHRGVQLLLDSSDVSTVDGSKSITTDTVMPLATPSSGSIRPGESLQISVRLCPSGYTPSRARTSRSGSWEVDGNEEEALSAIQRFEGMSIIIRDTDSPPSSHTEGQVDVKLVVENPEMLLLARNSEAVAGSQHFQDRSHALDLTFGGAAEGGAEAALEGETEEGNGRLPVLGLRGCTPIQGGTLKNVRYAVDIGQQTLRAGSMVEWEITVERLLPVSTGTVEYRLYTIHQLEQNGRERPEWLQLSRDRGVLDSLQPYHNITLYFLRDRLGYFSTYLIVENLTNSQDVKMIRVDMEVVADLKILAGLSSSDNNSPLFDVLVAGKKTLDRKLIRPHPPSEASASSTRPPLDLDFGEIMYHTIYHNRSIVIVNTSDLPLDFVLSSNVGNRELRFSLSATSLKPISSVSIEPRSKLQIFFRFFARPPSAEEARKEGSNLDQRTGAWDRVVEVYVACRLVKDFQQIIYIRCRCCHPQLQVRVDRDLRGVDSRPDSSLVPSSAHGSGAFALDDSITGPHVLSMAFVGRKIDPSDMGEEGANLPPTPRGGTSLAGLGQNHRSFGSFASFTSVASTATTQGTSSSSLSSSAASGTASLPAEKKVGGASGGGAVSSVATTAVTQRVRVEVEEGSSEGFLIIKNLKNSLAVAVIRNDTMFFTVEPLSISAAEEGASSNKDLTSQARSLKQSSSDIANTQMHIVQIPPNSYLTLQVRPNLEALAAHTLRWHRHVEEHITIYNKRYFPEKYVLSLRFTCGRSTNFYLAPGSRNEYPFATLEDTIAKFLREFSVVWNLVETIVVPGLKMLEELQTSSPRTGVPGRGFRSRSGSESRDRSLGSQSHRGSATPSRVSQLQQQLQLLDHALQSLKEEEEAEPLSPGSSSSKRFRVQEGGTLREPVHLSTTEIARRYREVYFEFSFITDQLVWYAVKKNVGRFAFNLANLVYTMVFSHKIFKAFMGQQGAHRVFVFPPLLTQWVNQLGHFLSFFPETLDVIEPLIGLHEELLKNKPLKQSAKSTTATSL